MCVTIPSRIVVRGIHKTSENNLCNNFKTLKYGKKNFTSYFYSSVNKLQGCGILVRVQLGYKTRHKKYNIYTYEYLVIIFVTRLSSKIESIRTNKIRIEYAVVARTKNTDFQIPRNSKQNEVRRKPTKFEAQVANQFSFFFTQISISIYILRNQGCFRWTFVKVIDFHRRSWYVILAKCICLAPVQFLLSSKANNQRLPNVSYWSMNSMRSNRFFG